MVLGGLGAVLRDLGVILGGLGPVLGVLVASWGGLGGLLGPLGAIQNRSKHRSENRSEIEPDRDGKKMLWSYACSDFRA